MREFELIKSIGMAAFLTTGAWAATLTGRVVDGSGGGIAGATVTAVHKESGTAKVAKTHEQGGYSIADLRPGQYTVRVEQQGFKPVLRNEVGVRGEEALEVVMELGARQESITVEGKGVKSKLKRWLTCR